MNENGHIDLAEMREGARKLASARRDALDDFEAQVQKRAQAIADHKSTRARVVMELRAAGKGVTEASEIADAEKVVFDSLIQRELHDKLLEAKRERIHGLDGERAMLRALGEWSQKYE